MIYLVSYDLRKSKDYARIEKTLERYAVRARVLLSQWLIQTDETSDQIIAAVRAGVDADDGILVTEVTKNMQWRNTLITDDLMRRWRDAARG